MTQQPVTPDSSGSNASKPSPAPQPPSYKTPAYLPKEDVNNLGYFLDGWADLIEGMGEKAEEVRQKVITGLTDRKMPSIYPIEVDGFASMTGSELRHYLLSTTRPGATTAIYVGKHGVDLYASWRTFIHPVFNLKVIGAFLLVAAGLGLMIGGIDRGTDWYGRATTSFSFSGWLLTTLFILFVTCVLAAIAGRIFKGSFMAFFFIEPNIFDAEDITAMSLSAHKSLLRALDNSGIDVTKLRLKREFKGGRRGEDV